MTEEWRPVVGWEGFYEVSDLGRVRSLPGRMRRGGIMTPDLAGRYLRVALHGNGRSQRRRVHLLVAAAFLGPRPIGDNGRPLDICHGIGGAQDNSAKNLRYDTRRANVLDSVRDGTHPLFAAARAKRKALA